ncbi:MAG: penicillin acylase family protein [Actinobacteria bacterium]|nr:penicillin acylase family protein [Actinomycetota bacterium]
MGSEWARTLEERARAGLPPVEGEIRGAGLLEAVEVVHDRWGVPHIYAESARDAYFAQGFVVASQRLFQMDMAWRLATGRISEMFGELTLPLDRFVRTVGWGRAARRFVGMWDERSAEMADAFAEGVRAWVETMPARPIEYDVLEVDPLVPGATEARELIAAAAIYVGWSLSNNWDAELLRAEIARRLGWGAVGTLFPGPPSEPSVVVAGEGGARTGPRATLELLREAPRPSNGQGSNNWVVGGRRSVTRMPLLANDPHLLVQMPSAWFEVHLRAPRLNVRGVAFPFSPGVVIGHNDRIAWGFTNVGGDTQDLYLERLSDDGTAALYQGTWEPLAFHREEIEVRGRSAPEIVEVRESRHGPILDSYLVGIARPEVVAGGIRETYALRFVGLEEALEPSTVHGLDTAGDFREFRSALRGWTCPGQNAVYADVEGNIGYQCTGLHPIRRAGDGSVPAPGWTDAFEWEGYVPFDELPWSYNPDEGFLVSANNKPYDDTYPWDLGRDFLPPHRARRITELLTATPLHDPESFARIQMDTVSLPARQVVPWLLEIRPADERQRRALALLEGWAFDVAPGSAAAAVFEVWSRRIAEAILRPRLGEELYDHAYARRQWTNTFQYQVLPHLLAYPTATWFGEEGRAGRDAVLREALDAALDELTAAFGPDIAAWSWGGLHSVRFAGPLAVIPDLAELFTGGVAPMGGDEQTVLQGLFEPGVSYEAVVVPSWRQIVDLADLDRSVGTNTVGQSGNPASPHFKDQFELWSTGRLHPLPFTRGAVMEAAESVVRLLPDPPQTARPLAPELAR